MCIIPRCKGQTKRALHQFLLRLLVHLPLSYQKLKNSSILVDDNKIKYYFLSLCIYKPNINKLINLIISVYFNLFKLLYTIFVHSSSLVSNVMAESAFPEYNPLVKAELCMGV